jgi:hypothetical protein
LSRIASLGLALAWMPAPLAMGLVLELDEPAASGPRAAVAARDAEADRRALTPEGSVPRAQAAFVSRMVRPCLPASGPESREWLHSSARKWISHGRAASAQNPRVGTRRKGAAARRAVAAWRALACTLAAVTATAADQPAPVVLELFTSQGCSSCPAAEDLLSRIGLDPDTRDLVVPLAYHVDYWNELGWRDPFSDRAWSFRQAAYQRVLKVDDGAYTPQLVVNGQAELNGTHAKRLLNEIDAALRRRAEASVELAAALVGAARPELVVDVTATILEDTDARTLELRVAIFENGVVTNVGRGENRGRTLRNDFIVRRLEKAFSFQSAKGARRQRQLRVKLDRDWKPQNLGVAAFLQDPGSLRILAAAARPHSEPAPRSP